MMMHNKVFLLLSVVVPMVVGTFPGKIKLSGLHSEREIDLRLKELNKPAIKSIHSPDGDIIDCVCIYNQPAFDHPLLKNHTIQMRPKSISIMDKTGGNKTNIIHQLWRTKGECPENTIPIRRTTRDDLLRSDSIRNYGRKKSPPPPPTIYQDDAAETLHELSSVHLSGQFHGSKSRISIWKPNVETKKEFSLAQTSVLNGDYNIGVNSLEAGWQIWYDFYGDYNPRFFTYWTLDAYRDIGCYNLACGVFVQVNNEFSLGGTLNPVSTYNGEQHDFLLTIQKDRDRWWLTYEALLIGYWPIDIVPLLALSASQIAWGGKITYSPSNPAVHTSTQMGSGHFAEEGRTRAAYISNLEYIDTSNRPITPYPHTLRISMTRPECYNLAVGLSLSLGTYILYGGPGFSPQCEWA